MSSLEPPLILEAYNGRGERYCGGEDGCFAKVEDFGKHRRWHLDLCELVDEIATRLLNVSTGAFKYEYTHAGDKPGDAKGTDDSDSRQASAESDLGDHEGVDPPLR